MAKSGPRALDTNDRFPDIELDLIDGQRLKLPEGLGEGYAVVLLYRGYW